MGIDGEKSLLLAIVMRLVSSLVTPRLELLLVVASTQWVVLRHEGAHHVLERVGFCVLEALLL